MTFPTVKSARPVYPPPAPTGPLPDPGGATPVDNAYRTQQQVANLYTQWRQAHSLNIAPEALRANKGAFAVSDAVLRLPEVLKPVKQDAEDANGRALDLMKSARVPDDDTAKQLAAQRYWARTQRTLDAMKDPAKLVAAAQDLIAKVADADVMTLAQELTEYFASRGIAAGWIPTALASKIPGMADAASDKILKHRRYAVLLQNDGLLRNAMSKDLAAPPLQDPGLVNAKPYLDSSTQ